MITFPRVLVADPAWSFKDNLPGPGRGAASHYSCVSLQDLQGFLPKIGLWPRIPDVLVMWRVASMQAEALSVIDCWGYDQPTSEIVWLKTTKSGAVATGLGRTVRNAHEIALICKRKGLPGWKAVDVVKDHGVRSVLEAEVMEVVDAAGAERVSRGECLSHALAQTELSLIRSPRGEHSVKPPEFYELIDRLFHGPVIELFARRQWKNWYCFGDEMPQGAP